MSETTYTGTIRPIEFDGLTPVYEVRVLRHVPAGVDGPCTEPTEFAGNVFIGAGKAFYALGFEMCGPISEVCGNGFATVELYRVEG
jgi:hypothetical protein